MRPVSVKSFSRSVEPSLTAVGPGLYRDAVESLPVRPERFAQLQDYARRRGKTTADALDEALAEYFEWERHDYDETVEAVRAGYEDMKAGRTEPAEEFLEDFRQKHGLPR